jgi:hypothetical protein
MVASMASRAALIRSHACSALTREPIPHAIEHLCKTRVPLVDAECVQCEKSPGAEIRTCFTLGNAAEL